jgi:hypothetical protein
MLTDTFAYLNRSIVSRQAMTALAATCLLATATVARASDVPTYPLICAQHDLRIVTLIELHGYAQLVSADTLAEAYFDVIKARDACANDRVAEGVAIYERLLPGLGEIEGDEIHAASTR